MTGRSVSPPTPERDYGPGCERHKGDPHNLCPKCWELEPTPEPEQGANSATPAEIRGRAQLFLDAQPGYVTAGERDLARHVIALADQVEELRSALEAIANADCTISMVGGCVGPTINVRKRRGAEFVPVERVNCAKHYAVETLARLAFSASALPTVSGAPTEEQT